MAILDIHGKIDSVSGQALSEDLTRGVDDHARQMDALRDARTRVAPVTSGMLGVEVEFAHPATEHQEQIGNTVTLIPKTGETPAPTAPFDWAKEDTSLAPREASAQIVPIRTEKSA